MAHDLAYLPHKQLQLPINSPLAPMASSLLVPIPVAGVPCTREFRLPRHEPAAPLLNFLLFGRQSQCHGDELQIHYPGFDDLRGKGWNNKARSYNCAAE